MVKHRIYAHSVLYRKAPTVPSEYFGYNFRKTRIYLDFNRREGIIVADGG